MEYGLIDISYAESKTFSIYATEQ